MIHRSIKSKARAIGVLTLSYAFFALAFCCPAATVIFTMTNSVGPDTNYIVIKGVNPHANSDGSYQSIGVPFRIYPNASGFVSTQLNNGTYIASNAFIVSTFAQPGSGGTLQGVVFNVDNTSNTNAFTKYLRSGYNIYNWYLGIMGIGGTNGFTIVTNGDGTVTLDGASFTPTVPQITNALGFLPLTPAQTTNAIALATNNFTKLVYTNEGQVMYTNLLPALTNKFATTNYAVGLSNTLRALIDAGGAVQTNGFTTLVFTNPGAIINTNQIAAVTNRHLLTNDSRAFNLSNDQNRVGTLTASAITNVTFAIHDATVGGWWFIRTNGAGAILFYNTSDGGTILFDTDGTIQNNGNTILGGFTRSDIFYGDNGGFVGDGRNVTNFNSTNLAAGTYIQNTNLYHIITSNEFNTTTWFLATNRDGGNAVYATNVTAGITNAWQNYSSNSTYAASNALYSAIQSGGQATNAIANTNGRGTNIIIQSLSVTSAFTAQLTASANTFIAGPNTTIGGGYNGIFGGEGNSIVGNNWNAILGGYYNTLGVSYQSVILGGVTNKIASGASADHNVIAGGMMNYIGPGVQDSFVQGIGHSATGSGSVLFGRTITNGQLNVFAWSGSQPLTPSRPDSFIIQATNGVGINTNSPADNALSVHGKISSTNYTIQGNVIVVQSTNYLDVSGAGTTAANGGAYQWDATAGQYTNANTGSMLSNNTTVWIIKNSSANSLYTSSTLIASNWTAVGGVNPPPAVAYGAIHKLGGEIFEGYLNSTNLSAQMTNVAIGMTNASIVRTNDNRNFSWGGINVTGLANSGSSYFSNTVTAPSIDGRIYVMTNEIDGLNHALTNLFTSPNKMNAGAGKIYLQPGIHYITTALFYTNQYPAALDIEGDVKPGTYVVYIGPQTNANIFRFMGNNASDGVLLQLRLKGIGFSSIWDNTNWLVQIQQAGHLEIEGCQFVPWTIATNNINRGIAVSEDEVSTRFTNLSGLYLGPGDTGVGISVRDCGFIWLQNGMYDGTDHILAENNYFSVCGGGPSGTAINTGWPTNSLFRLGGSIVRDATPSTIAETLYFKNHFTRDHICILDNDPGTQNKLVIAGRAEGCTYRYVSTASGSFSFFSSLNSGALDRTAAISGTSYAISGTPPNVKYYGEYDQVAVNNLMLYPAFAYGLRVDTAGNSYLTGTNSARAISQSVNLDSGYFRVTGGEAGYNGTYLFKEQDQRALSTANWRTVWTNTENTNTIVYDPLAGLPWGLYNITNDIDNVVYFNESASIDPPPTTWDPNTGTSNNITATFIYGKFKANPDGSIESLSSTVRSNFFVSGPIYITNTITIYTNLSGVMPALTGGAGTLWNSNADLYWVSAAPFGSTRTTNLIQAH